MIGSTILSILSPLWGYFFNASPPRQYYNLLPSLRDLWRKGGTKLGLAWYCSIGLVVLEAHKKGGFLSKKGGRRREGLWSGGIKRGGTGHKTLVHSETGHLDERTEDMALL